MSTAEMGQGEGTLSRAATLVADARSDFDRLSRDLEGRIQGLQGQWVGQGGTAFFALHRAWTEKQAVIVGALDGFERSLVATEKDNVATDETQMANYQRNAARLA
ncbi:WXG100 family type VII secretion target [Nocardioides rotundus]|uniref:WXG100 family type VII secretion target n=1 Tax=Nocardioides rotundus TaxID=1774216 RepID=UPI001CBB3881|nr:WXG100 family type VII secretion target [Nocardioides rotundus]UAL29513.1 WXG100 family type VII secretion target [Nocardioides rotundus]